MALKYTSYAIGYGAGIQVSGSLPLDIRTVVQNKSDLTNASTWAGNPVYHGLLVSVTSEKQVYMFIPANGTGYDPTVESSWKKIGSSNSKIEVITVDEYEAWYTVPSGTHSGEKVALYGRHIEDESVLWWRADLPQSDPEALVLENEGNVHHDINYAAEDGFVIDNASVSSAGTYIKVTDLDSNTVTYAKIDFSEIYNKINDVSVRVNDLSIYIADVSADLAKLGNAFVFRGTAYVNSSTTPDTSNYLVDAEGHLLPNLRGGDVYQVDSTKEWVYVADSSIAGHWVELGLTLDGFITNVSVNTDSYLNATVSERDNTGKVTIDISAYIGSIDTATEDASGLVTAYDVSLHLASLESKIS